MLYTAGDGAFSPAIRLNPPSPQALDSRASSASCSMCLGPDGTLRLARLAPRSWRVCGALPLEGFRQLFTEGDASVLPLAAAHSHAGRLQGQSLLQNLASRSTESLLRPALAKKSCASSPAMTSFRSLASRPAGMPTPVTLPRPSAVVAAPSKAA